MRNRFLQSLILCCIEATDMPTGGGGGAPAPAQTPPAGTPPPATPAATPPAPEKDPDWLGKRIANAKKSAEADVLKQLGVTDVEAAKKAIADLKAKEDAEKTAAQKAAELATKLTAAETEKAATTWPIW